MEIKTIFNKLGKKNTINFIKNRGIMNIDESKTISYIIYEIANYDKTQEIIQDYIMLRNNIDFYRYLKNGN